LAPYELKLNDDRRATGYTVYRRICGCAGDTLRVQAKAQQPRAAADGWRGELEGTDTRWDCLARPVGTTTCDFYAENMVT
jgi:hypothetical protein